MKFEEALAAMREGKKVRRVGWAECISLDDTDDVELSECLHVDWEIYEEPKWEPRGGQHLVSPLTVEDLTGDFRSMSDGFRRFGIQRETYEQAEAARDKMRQFNRLLAYVDEHSDPAEECNAKIFHNGTWVWTTVPLGHQLPDTILMPKRVAEQLCKDLNSGRVKL